MIPCPKCSRENADDALYCDQCRTGVSPGVEGAVLEEPCPACGGKVKEVPSTTALCSDCGIFMGGGGPAPCEPGPHEPGQPAPAAAPAAEEGEKSACPVCGFENADSAAVCGGCAIAFSGARRARECPKCQEQSDEDKCRCGAIMTLPKLLGYVDASAKVVCATCKQLFTIEKGACSDCGGETLPAGPLKDYAASRRG